MDEHVYKHSTSSKALAPTPQSLSVYQHDAFEFRNIRQVLNAESHIFIVLLGAILGGIIALAIGYSIEASALHYCMLSLIPVVTSYILRHVYIYTLIHFQE